MPKHITEAQALEAQKLFDQHGNKSKVARILKVGPDTVKRRLDEAHRMKVLGKIGDGKMFDAYRFEDHAPAGPDQVGPDHLVIGDAHSKPGETNRRFTWLGKFIVEHRPAKIIDIGDWGDFPSLCSHDKFRQVFEGRRLHEDIAAACDARARVEHEIAVYNDGQRAQGLPIYNPERYHVTGNHEDRLNREAQLNPALFGTIGTDMIGTEKYGWTVVPFLDKLVLDGVTYCHYFVSGAKGQPITGVTQARTMLARLHASVTCGHSHIRDFSEDTSVSGRKMLGLVAGCYFEHDERYATHSNNKWWRGLVLCKNVVDGVYDPHFHSMQSIKHRYA